MQARCQQISSRTGLVGLLGHPVLHSLSPVMLNAAFAAQKLDMVYLAFDVAPDDLSRAVEGMRSLGMHGANVTVPHKEKVVGLLDAADSLALRVGAVNTIVNDGDRLVGYNTDVAGFLAALRLVRDEGARGLRCLVAGAGGAARAVVAALCDDAAEEVWVYNRTASRALSLCATAASWGQTICCPLSVDELPAQVAAADLIVNATSVGLETSVKVSPIPVDNLDSRQIVMDLVYGPNPTVLVAAAMATGARALDGREMLVMQAASSYRLWTGMEPPVATMRESLDR